eukprot:11699493-Heterocapsa_arctica.AAC.1
MAQNNRQRRKALMKENRNRKTLIHNIITTFTSMKTTTVGMVKIGIKEDTRIMRRKITLESFVRKG